MATPQKTVPDFRKEDRLFVMILNAPYLDTRRLKDACRGLERIETTHKVDLGVALSQLSDAITPHVSKFSNSLPWPSGTKMRVARIPDDPGRFPVLIADVPGLHLPVIVRYNGLNEVAPSTLVDIPTACRIEGFYNEVQRKPGVQLVATLIPAPQHKPPPEGVLDSRSLSASFPELCELAKKPYQFNLGFYA